MSRPSRLLLIAMSFAFAVCILGLLLGLSYDLFAIYIRHQSSESVLGNAIPYNKSLGAIGLLGFLLFLAFLLSLMLKKNPK